MKRDAKKRVERKRSSLAVDVKALIEQLQVEKPSTEDAIRLLSEATLFLLEDACRKN